jgi:hypothetical protein
MEDFEERLLKNYTRQWELSAMRKRCVLSMLILTAMVFSSLIPLFQACAPWAEEGEYRLQEGGMAFQLCELR